MKDLGMFSAQMDKLFSKAEEAFKTISEEIRHSNPEELFCNAEMIKRQLMDFSIVELSTQSYLNNSNSSSSRHPELVSGSSVNGTPKQVQGDGNKFIEFNTKPQPSFNKHFDLLIDNLIENT